ncbi:MAG: hypothetical protein ACQGVC_26230, partial [Myxococcota bacterium]
LPSLPPALPDLEVFGDRIAYLRGGGEITPPVDPEVADCLAARPLVLAEDAARIVWQHDVVAIYAPARPRLVARILDEHPVGRVQLRDAARVPPGRLAPSRDCGPDWYAPVGGG